MVDGVGMNRLDDCQFIDDSRSEGQKFADKSPALTMLIEFELARRNWQSRLAAGHRCDPLTFANTIGKVLVELLCERWLVIPCIDLRWSPVHVEVDDRFCLGGEMGKSG